MGFQNFVVSNKIHPFTLFLLKENQRRETFVLDLQIRYARKFCSAGKLTRTLLSLLLLMPAAQAQVGNTKLFINYFRNPTSISVTEN